MSIDAMDLLEGFFSADTCTRLPFLWQTMKLTAICCQWRMASFVKWDSIGLINRTKRIINLIMLLSASET